MQMTINVPEGMDIKYSFVPKKILDPRDLKGTLSYSTDKIFQDMEDIKFVDATAKVRALWREWTKNDDFSDTVYEIVRLEGVLQIIDPFESCIDAWSWLRFQDEEDAAEFLKAFKSLIEIIL